MVERYDLCVAENVDNDPQASPLRPKPGPTPPRPGEPVSYIVDRRRIVLGLGFGIATAAGMRHLPDTESEGDVVASGSEPSASTEELPEGLANGDIATEVADVTVVNEVGPFEAPIFDEALRLPSDGVAEVVLTGGRIIDPETGFDRIGNIGISEGIIVEISHEPIRGVTSIDVSNRVVSPGFIDMLSYSPNGYGEWWKVADGVTANVGMHGLRFDAADFYQRWNTEGSPIHFGGAVHNSHIRDNLGFGPDLTVEGSDIGSISDAIETQVRSGYLGIHAQPEYAPGVSALEMVDMGHLAARLGVPLCVHARYSDNLAPGLQSEATGELVSVARQTGAHIHVEHLNSTGGTGRMADALAEIQAALDEGLSMSACMYPYEFWATTLKSARFRDWQEKFGLDYSDLQVAGTDTPLTADTFQAAFDNNALTAAFAIPPGDIELGMQSPFMMLGSDAILERSHNNHPRSTGCFSRVLGVYVREQGLISLVDALAMLTVRPANLLGLSSPAMRRKGRMQIGADADVTVFNSDTITDTSTISNPAQESVGVDYVYVAGTQVRSPQGTDRSAFPGRAITSLLA